MEYKAQGLLPGIIVSVSTLVLLTVVLVILKARKKKLAVKAGSSNTSTEEQNNDSFNESAVQIPTSPDDYIFIESDLFPPE